MDVFGSANSSTAQTVAFITCASRGNGVTPQPSSPNGRSFLPTDVQDLKRKLKSWAPLIELCGSGEKTLERMRFQFPDEWLYYDQLNGEWNAFQEILRRKNDSIQEQLGLSFRSREISEYLTKHHSSHSWSSTQDYG